MLSYYWFFFELLLTISWLSKKPFLGISESFEFLTGCPLSAILPISLFPSNEKLEHYIDCYTWSLHVFILRIFSFELLKACCYIISSFADYLTDSHLIGLSILTKFIETLYKVIRIYIKIRFLNFSELVINELTCQILRIPLISFSIRLMIYPCKPWTRLLKYNWRAHFYIIIWLFLIWIGINGLFDQIILDLTLPCFLEVMLKHFLANFQKNKMTTLK